MLGAYLIPSTWMALNPRSLSKACCICKRRSAFYYLIYQSKHIRSACAEDNIINPELVNYLAGHHCVSIQKGQHEWGTFIDIYLWAS